MVILISQDPGGDSSRNKLNLWNKSALSDSHKKTIPPRRVFALAKCDCGSRLSRSAFDSPAHVTIWRIYPGLLRHTRAISQLRLVDQLFTINIFLWSKIILKQPFFYAFGRKYKHSAANNKGQQCVWRWRETASSVSLFFFLSWLALSWFVLVAMQITRLALPLALKGRSARMTRTCQTWVHYNRCLVLCAGASLVLCTCESRYDAWAN